MSLESITAVFFGIAILTTMVFIYFLCKVEDPIRRKSSPTPRDLNAELYKLNNLKLKRPYQALCARHCSILLKKGEVALLDQKNCTSCKKKVDLLVLKW